MPAVETRVTKKHGTRYRVRFRDPTTQKASSRTFNSKEDARRFARYIERHGVRVALARWDHGVTLNDTIHSRVNDLERQLLELKAQVRLHLDGRTPHATS